MPRDFELTVQVALDAGPDVAWPAIATGEGLAAWFMPMPVDPHSAMVKVWEPGVRLVIEMPPAPDGGFQAFDYAIDGRGDGTSALRFTHRGVLGDGTPDGFEAMTLAGWQMYLHTLGQYERHFPGRRAQYVEADGPPSSSSPDSWARLLAALGLDPAVEPVALGAWVGIELAGTDPIGAEVDYAAEHFVGLRAADALVRFHERSSIGMPIAVSHHVYLEPVDVPALTRAWVSWLAEACG